MLPCASHTVTVNIFVCCLNKQLQFQKESLKLVSILSLGFLLIITTTCADSWELAASVMPEYVKLADEVMVGTYFRVESDHEACDVAELRPSAELSM